MKTKAEDREGYGKLLELWEPPKDRDPGEAVGCLATSFTFDPVFFEQECLGRFLGLQSDPDSEALAYLLEREEKLAAATCAALVDQHHCRGTRSLRWDLLPARMQKRVLHAKVSLLHWTGYTRLIVASANLTPSGYRRNQEVAGALDFYPGSESPLEVLREALRFLGAAAATSSVGAPVEKGALQRWTNLVNRVSKDSKSWGQATQDRQDMKVFGVFTAPGKPSALEQVRAVWPGGPPSDAWVTSPFFDIGREANQPARHLWSLLRQRGKASVTFGVVAEPLEDGKGFFARAPESLLKEQPGGSRDVETLFTRLDPRDKTGEDRDFHLKAYWFENETRCAYMIGSSNFTSAGLGIGKDSNLEANLVYVCPTDAKCYSRLAERYIEGEDLPASRITKWEPLPDEAEDDGALPALPRGFKDAVYGLDAEGAFVTLAFGPELPDGWVVRHEGAESPLMTESQWREAGRPGEVRVPWSGRPPAGFEVTWAATKGPAWWPVNVSAQTALPPIEQLRELSLDELVEILSSARPLHQVLERLLRRREKRSGSNPEEQVELDALRRVDSSGFLLQRTRRVAWALEALRQRLEKPAATIEAVWWRLRGPVGVQAVANAISREARSDEERKFLLAELCLELSRVQPQEVRGFLAAELVREETRTVIRELKGTLAASGQVDTPLGKYVTKALAEAMR